MWNTLIHSNTIIMVITGNYTRIQKDARQVYICCVFSRTLFFHHLWSHAAPFCMPVTRWNSYRYSFMPKTNAACKVWLSNDHTEKSYCCVKIKNLRIKNIWKNIISKDSSRSHYIQDWKLILQITSFLMYNKHISENQQGRRLSDTW